ncbi:predicted protein [Uncinocarpus reesii 1704]|uniref:Tat pathway signal sequence n=1 Tax=Uncinocarpus reesii (strain UAMH 1704) TaxID=336963 RepID=C4JWM2_UNCRE|nr:uncharacterized protein UREG_06964 [Uncinocarpus reesii 1704]EEP82099.1 predicted protein [Uncinocarpus reesii 1704]
MDGTKNVNSGPTYAPLDHDRGSESDSEALSPENEGFLRQKRRSTDRQRMWTISARTCTILNVCFSIFLLGLWASIYRPRNCGIPDPPYSPIWEDGAVKPQKIFQSETSDEVERAWNASMGPSEGTVVISKERAAKLPETVEAWFKPGHYVYGVSVFHQLHCLNRIRKTFYADKFFAHESEEVITFHKNHCFDLLRQTIMCNGDASLVHWWNENYTYIDNTGQKQYSQEYLSMSPKERATNSFITWDVKTRCHDIDAITEWTRKHQAGTD